MKTIVKKQLPTNLKEKLTNSRAEELYNTYYLIDGKIYIHTEFYVAEDDPKLELIHDMSYLEAEMIKDMQASGKIYIDEQQQTFYDLYHLALWFYEKIPSKDWQDLLNFLKMLKEHELMNNFIKLPSDEPVIN